MAKISQITAEAKPEIAGIDIIISIQLEESESKGVKKPVLNLYRKKFNDANDDWGAAILSKTVSLNFENNTEYKLHFLDVTIESGVFYKYWTQLDTEDKGVDTGDKNPIYCFYDDMYLVDKDHTFRIKFNPQVGGIKHNIQHSITTTLGSQYPIVRRNGAVEYKSFTLSGLISIDAERIFYDDVSYVCAKDSLFKENEQPVEEDWILDFKGSPYFGGEYAFSPNLFNDDDPIIKSNQQYRQLLAGGKIEYTDYCSIMEKLYRDEIIKFLHSDNIKLFKSHSEGHMLVYLTNVSLTPNQQLGRDIYEFSCQATEVLPIEDFSSYKKVFDYKQNYEFAVLELLTQNKGEDNEYDITSEPVVNYSIREESIIESYGGDERHEVCTLILRLRE